MTAPDLDALAGLLAWQPRETAPEDGTVIWVRGPSLVHEDFTPDGIVEACFDGERFIGAVWDGQHDVWRTDFIEFTEWLPRNAITALLATARRERRMREALAEALAHWPAAAILAELTPLDAETVRSCPLATMPKVADVMRWRAALAEEGQAEQLEGGRCCHQLRRESDVCRHGLAMGTTCRDCILSCTACWDTFASSHTYGPRPTEEGQNG